MSFVTTRRQLPSQQLSSRRSWASLRSRPAAAHSRTAAAGVTRAAAALQRHHSSTITGRPAPCSRPAGCRLAVPAGGNVHSFRCAAMREEAPPPPPPSDRAEDHTPEDLKNLQHALNGLLPWGGAHRLRLLHSSDDFTRMMSSSQLLPAMFQSIAYKGPTVTLLQYGDCGKAVGVYLEQQWSKVNTPIHVSAAPIPQ
jgi:hypothetical protein